MPSLKNNDITSKEKLQEKKLIGTKPKLKAGSGGNGNNPPLPGNPTEDYCFSDLFQTTPNTENAYVVVGDGCSNISTNHSEINYQVKQRNDPYPISVKDINDYTQLIQLTNVCVDDPNPNEVGGSTPIEYKRYKYDYNTGYFTNSWNLEPYKKEDHIYYYFINPQSGSPTPIIFDYVAGVCYLKIKPPWNEIKTLIENIDEVDDNSIIIPTDAKQAFADFCGHNCYPMEIHKYELIEIIRIHEREHMADYEGVIAKNFPLLKDQIETYRDECSGYHDGLRVRAENIFYEQFIYPFIKNAIAEWQEISGGTDSLKVLEHEKIIQGRESIKNRIINYMDKLKKRFPNEFSDNKKCPNCSYQEN